ncbi:MAG: sigma factor-like helix-turn-helix DNA-binding protein [Patescibacteria group bacterium]|jgi:hypothetical protein
MEDSILDRILDRSQTSKLEQFNPQESLQLLLKVLGKKEEDVLARRYGLQGGKKETLEEIGTSYDVTRERIRQIENAAIAKMRESSEFDTHARPIEKTLTGLLAEHGGIMEEDHMHDSLLAYLGENAAQRNVIRFFMGELLKDQFHAVPESEVLRRSWKLSDISLDFVHQVMDEIYKTIQEHGAPKEFDVIHKSFTERPFHQEHRDRLAPEVVRSYLVLSKKVASNPFNEYGLAEWGSVKPRRMNDKIFLILKKHGEPLHFTDITRRINEAQFDKRKAYPPTVHNELILNDRYVLVGRGIYGLKEWGYKPGVVLDVIKEILRETDEGLTRDEIVKKVMEQRMVKKNTVHLALTNKKHFEKTANGTYIVAVSQNETPT